MGDEVSQIENSAKDEQHKESQSICLRREFFIQYRLLRKKLSSFLRCRLKKNFVNILYITPENPPTDYILALQKQYPDKAVKVLVPLNKESNDFEKMSVKIDYFMQNRKHSAVFYKIPAGYDNVQVYGVYTEAFADIEHEQDIYDIKYISHFAKIARKAALKLKPDIIHANNVPLLMGLEFEDRWLSGYPVKYIQVLHNFKMYKNIEPFWAAINLANKAEMKKICDDNSIRKYIASIFNIDTSKKITKIKPYINFIYKKYDEYRKTVPQEETTRENVLLERINERILKIFPKMSVKNERFYNPAYYSMKHASVRAVNFMSSLIPAWAQQFDDVLSLPQKCNVSFADKIRHSFNIENYRETRVLNKKYLVRELSEKRIGMKFYDINLFEDDDIKLRGYLDSFFKSPLFFVPINEFVSLQDIKTVSLAVLKAFELRKNIQVVYSYPEDLNNSYLNSLFEFFESQSVLNGKWLAVEGKLNLPQFLSASDMVLIPSAECFNVENILYASLKYGCIPVVGDNAFSEALVHDIFEDLNDGCIFKTDENPDGAEDGYETLFLKALDFYANNSGSWNLVLKNAMSYDSGWNFKAIEEYNNVYEELI